MSSNTQLTLNLRIQVQKTQASAVGVTQYDGGEAFEVQGNRMVATFMSQIDTVNGVTDVHNLNSGMFDLTLFFVSAAGHQGGGGGARVEAPENIRLQGAPDLEGRQPPTAHQAKDIELVIGSVSAASPTWQQLIGKQFRLERTAQGQGQGQQRLLKLTIG